MCFGGDGDTAATPYLRAGHPARISFVHMKPNSQVFRPTALELDRLNDLLEVVRSADATDALELAVSLRRLAESARTQHHSSLEVQWLMLSVAASVLADLVEQGWELEAGDREVLVSPPRTDHTSGETVERIKARIRSGLMMSSDRQLASPATREFIEFMERQRAFSGRVVSIHDVVDDGQALAARLRSVAQLPLADRSKALSGVIRPVVQVCEPDARCEFTGLKLLDIWRYFRHTWALEYNPVPGRTLRILIRNKARTGWPIMGIAMLSSPAANLYARDSWIGWRTEDLIEKILSGDWNAEVVGKRMLAVIRQSIADIRADDLATPDELESGDKKTLFRLGQIVVRAAADRRNDLSHGSDANYVIDIRSLGADPSDFGDDEWRRLSDTALYRRKRAEQLLPLVETLKYLKAAGMEDAPAAALYEILVTKKGVEAVSLVLNEIRKRGLASDVADLSVCGAIAPYNHLLGGKLVALLMASQDVREIYQSRYKDKPSEIASQVAGRRVVRASDLKVLTTTSLYGINSSQYNRLKLRAGTTSKLFNDLAWEELDKTQGYSVTHFSKRTVALMRELGRVVHGRRKINSVFGEGSSPRTRQIRQGLLLIGISHGEFLKQPSGRRVYACETYPGARDDLIGFCRRTRNRKAPRVDAIARAWAERWVVSRVARPDVLERIADEDRGSVSRELSVRILRGSADAENEDASEGLSGELALALTADGTDTTE